MRGVAGLTGGAGLTGVAGLTGGALLLALWLLPWAAWLGPFPGHMLRHVGVVAVVAPLLILGWPGIAARLPSLPIAAAAVEGVVVWAWHLPALHMAARQHAALGAAEQASFLAAGLLVWAAALGPAGAGDRLAGAGALLLTSMHMTLLGALLILAPRDLYAHGAPDLAGQQAGGIVMLAIATPVYLLAGVALVAAGLRERGTA